MALSNTTQTTLAASPYWDDFDKSKGFHRVLFRPGKRAVQVRELNQTQSILQNQVDGLGTGVFKEGAAVSGGNISLANNVLALQVVRNDDVDISNFFDANTGVGHIVRGSSSLSEARVIQVDRQLSEDYAAVLIAPMSANEFAEGELVSFVDATTNSVTATMTVSSATATRPAATVSVQEGTFFLRGHLVYVPQQTLVLSTSSTTPSLRLGFDIAEQIVTSTDDASLLDPAFGASNYAAPGADRLKITATLAYKTLIGSTPVEQNSDEGFVEVLRIVNGVPAQSISNTAPLMIEDTLARRTYDESGDYVTRPFRLTTKPHNPSPGTSRYTGTITGNTSSTTIVAGGVPTLFQSELAANNILIVNGERRTITSVSSNTALAVNSAFSVDFSNTTFTVSKEDKLNLELEAGKAYVRGYEFETIGTTILEVDKPRTTATVNNAVVGSFFGPYVYVTRPANSSILQIHAQEKVDLHCADFDGISANSGIYNATKIGTARARDLVYAAGSGDGNTVYKLYLVGAEFQSKTIPYAGADSSTGFNTMAVNTTTGVVTLTQNAASANVSVLAQGNNAYIGTTVTFTGTDGSTLSYYVTNSTSSVTNTAGTHYTVVALTLDTPAYTSKINTTASVLFSFTDKALRGVSDSSSKSRGASVDLSSKLGNITTGNTALVGTDNTPLLFKFRESWVKGSTINVGSYDTIQYFSGVTGTATGNTWMRYTLTANATETFYPTSNGVVYTNFVVANSLGKFVSLASGSASVGISGNSAELYFPPAAVDTGNITVLARVSTSYPTAKSKTLYFANTSKSNVEVSSSNLVSNLASTRGHIAINTINASSSNALSLGVADVHALKYVYAVPNPSDTSTWVDVTDRYTLDNGQRTWCYDYASIVLKPGYSHHPTAAQAVVMLDRFEHSAANGYCTGASYVGSGLADDYVDIPTFTDPVTGKTIPLRDYIDFRPIRTANAAYANTAANSTTYLNATAVFANTSLPHPDSSLLLNYQYYLPRTDKVVLSKNRELKVIQGLPSTTPVPPADPENSMTLYVVKYPAYVANTDLVQVQPVEHKRYTMRDIGRLEKRIEKLEYYVQLSLLEERTLNQPELDGMDIERFKNGILIDPFSSYAIANPSDVDYRASIDHTKRELRPAFKSYSFQPNKYVPAQSAGTTRVGTGHLRDDVVMLDYTTEAFVTQPLASTRVNVNPFNVASWRGTVALSPSTDQWMDTLSRGTVTINLFDENSNWTSGNDYGFGTVWGDWQDNWSGKTVDESSTVVFGTGIADGETRQQWFKTETTETVVSQTNTPWRTGQQIVAKLSVVEKSLGDRVVDIAVAPNMRKSNVAIAATSLKPNSNLVAFFDERDVTNYVERANEIRLANSSVASTFLVGEQVTSNAAGANVGSALIAGIVNDTLRVVNATGRFYESGGNVNVTGAESGSQTAVSAYVSWSGVLTGAPSTANLALDSGALTTTGAYVGNVISITSGTGAGQRSTILTYDGVYASLSPALSIAPTAGSTYSIGPLKTDGLSLQVGSGTGYDAANTSSVVPGSFYGLFRLPGTTKSVDGSGVETLTAPDLRFSTGRKVFRLTDNASTSYATTQAEGVYEASGTTKIVENTVVATRELSLVPGPKITQTGSPVTVSTSTTDVDTYFTGVYVDPLAQTFLVDAAKYRRGVFMESVDLFFAKADAAQIPVTVQIRPTINGYPSSDRWLTQATRYSVNVVPENTTPNPDDATHVTKFTFPNPVYLLPGQEYAVVILSNSFEYEVFVGQIGEPVIGDTRIISEQPYGGSFFKSQNARTWTAEQTQDLMFVLHKAVFETSGTATFNLSESINSSSTVADSSGNFEYDLINLQTGHLEFPSTSNSGPATLSTYTLQVTNADNNALSSFGSVRVDQNIPLDERAIIRTGNTTCLDFRIAINTNDTAVSPVYDLGRVSMIAVKNIIDNGQLYANGFTIVSPGSGYTNSTSFVISANDSHGSGVVATAYVNSTGYVANVQVSTVGSGYIETPTLTWSEATTWGTQANAVIIYRGETSANVDITGEQKARYITRRVTLADGFDASDLKVYLSANRPTGTNIEVYYKALATGDRENFNEKPWTRMIVKAEQAEKYSGSDTQFNEYEFRTTSNSASYTTAAGTFDRFHTFAIKTVLRSESTIKVPVLRNLRAIALDE